MVVDLRKDKVMTLSKLKFRKLAWLSVIPVVAIACYYGAKHLTIGIKAYAQIHTTPFVLEVDYHSFANNPQGQLIEKRITARRTDGSTSVITILPPHWEISARAVTFLNGTRINAIDFISSKSTWKTGAADLAALKERLANPPANCVFRGDSTFLRNETLAGNTVAVVELIEGGGRSTRWSAPGLGCEQLQWRYEIQQPDGTYKLDAEATLVSIKLQEPEASYFDPSLNFQEVRPSEAIRRTFEKLGAPSPPDLKVQGERLDKDYTEHQ